MNERSIMTKAEKCKKDVDSRELRKHKKVYTTYMFSTT